MFGAFANGKCFFFILNDVLAKDPDVVIIYIGVNDVWHKTSSGTGTGADKFEKFYQAVIDKLKAKSIKNYSQYAGCNRREDRF